MSTKEILINRAPVLTLWAAVVAQRMGFKWDEALSLGKTLAGLTAQSKGRRLGIYRPSAKKEMRERKHGEVFYIGLLGRNIPAQNTPDGVRAVNKERVITSESAQKYIESKFGDGLNAVLNAMRKLENANAPKELDEIGFKLYEKFRPTIPRDEKGWGARGELSTTTIEYLAKGD